MKVIIVEDEHHSYRLLRGMIEIFRPEWEVLGNFKSVDKTVAWLKSNPSPDLIFMDIQLTDGICFSIFEQHDVDSMIIFTTAYNEYAVQAFKVNSIDYLLKPVKEEDLKESIGKFEQIYDRQNPITSKADYHDILNAIIRGEKKYRKRFLVAGASALFKVDVKNIALIYTENRNTYVVSFKGDEHHLDQTIENIEGQLDPEYFFRANRSVILHIDAISKIESYFGGKLLVQLIPPLKDKVTVSRLKASDFKKWLGGIKQ